MLVHKIEIAKRQIETAGELFLSNKDPLAVVTLAGAAEEILGCLLRRQNEPSMYDRLSKDEDLGAGKLEPKELNQIINGARNALKHANDPNEDEIEFEPEEAVAMITRALANYTSLGLEPSPVMIEVYLSIKNRPPYAAP